MATRLEEFRKKYPGLNDVDDEKLSKALHQKYYSEEEYDRFRARMDEDQEGATAPDLKRPPTNGDGISAGDVGRSFGGGVLEGAGATIEGGGELLKRAAEVAVAPVNALFDTELVPENPYERLARPIRSAGATLKEGMSQDAQAAVKGSTPRGNILKGEVDLGSDPSWGGYLLQGANVAGQLVPALAGGAATAGMKTAAQLTTMGGITAAQTGGAALSEESDRIRRAEQKDLNRMPGYIDLIAEGKSHEAAREELALNAGRSAFNWAAPVGAGSGLILGAGLSKPVQNFMARLLGPKLGQSAVARGVTTAAAEAPMEGAQEITEGVAQRFGGARATKEDRELGEGTAAEGILGMMGGGFGGTFGAFTRPDAKRTLPADDPDLAPDQLLPADDPDLEVIEGRPAPDQLLPADDPELERMLPADDPDLLPGGSSPTQQQMAERRQSYAERLRKDITEGRQLGGSALEFAKQYPQFGLIEAAQQHRQQLTRPRLPPPGPEQGFAGEQGFPTSARGATEPQASEIPQTARYVAANTEEERLKAEREVLLARDQEIRAQGFALPPDQQAAFFDDENGEFNANYALVNTNRRAIAAAETETLAAQQEAIAERSNAKKQPGFERPRPDIGRVAQEMEGTIPAPVDPQALDDATVAPARHQMAIADMDRKERDDERAELVKTRRGRPDAQNDNFLSWIAKSGGFNREAWASEGMDEQHFRDPRNRHVVGRPLFPREGGLTPDDLAERMLESGFFPEQDSDARLQMSANDTHAFVFKALANPENSYFGPAAWKQGRLDEISKFDQVVGQEIEDAQGYIDQRATFADAQEQDRQIPDTSSLSAPEADLDVDNEIERQFQQASEELGRPAPTRQEVQIASVALADLTADHMEGMPQSVLLQAAKDLLEDNRSATLGSGVKLPVWNMVEFRHRERRGELDNKDIVFIDLDEFKTVNDTHGHPVGDEVLVEFNKAMKVVLDQLGGDVFHRGGDENLLTVDGGTGQQLLDELAILRDEFHNIEFEGVDQHTGEPTRFNAPGFSFGLGEDEGTAERAQHADKRERARLGLRSDRRPRDGQQTDRRGQENIANDDARLEESEGRPAGEQDAGAQSSDQEAERLAGLDQTREPEDNLAQEQNQVPEERAQGRPTEPAPDLELQTSDVAQPQAEPEPEPQPQPSVQEPIDAANVDQTRDIEEQLKQIRADNEKRQKRYDELEAQFERDGSLQAARADQPEYKWILTEGIRPDEKYRISYFENNEATGHGVYGHLQGAPADSALSEFVGSNVRILPPNEGDAGAAVTPPTEPGPAPTTTEAAPTPPAVAPEETDALVGDPKLADAFKTLAEFRPDDPGVQIEMMAGYKGNGEQGSAPIYLRRVKQAIVRGLPVPERVLTQRVQDVMSAEEIQDHREFLQRTDRAEARNLPVKETLVAFDQMVAEGIFAPFASVANYDPSFITLKQLRKRVMAQIKFDPAVIEAFRSDGDFENNLQQHWDSAADLVLGQMKRDGQSLHSGNPKTMIPALQRALLTQIEGEARKASNAENRPDATTKVEDERSTGEEGDLFQQPEAQGTPLSEITIKYVGELQLFDENGDPLATEATADIALAEVDQQIETIRKFRECLLS